MKADFAIVAGTGIAPRLQSFGGTPVFVPTPFGGARGKIATIGGAKVFLVQRHGSGHTTPPHGINYRAIASALKQMGVRACFSTAACGSLRTDWKQGTLAVCADFVDLTGRNLTLFERGVRHTAFSPGFAGPARRLLLEAAAAEGIPIRDGGTYVGMNGPRYETPAEVAMIAKVGDLVGMTASSEAVAMGEADVPYACLAVVTNLAAGLEDAPPVHEAVVDQMNASGEDVVRILVRAVGGVAP